MFFKHLNRLDDKFAEWCGVRFDGSFKDYARYVGPRVGITFIISVVFVVIILLW